mmetsp:Transcript_97884/g.285617  ORF Transcript_97884/g.285617 Transcript_97884/m.285617 type:complete len:386 (+) Transcript_97884:402-1559(+)
MLRLQLPALPDPDARSQDTHSAKLLQAAYSSPASTSSLRVPIISSSLPCSYLLRLPRGWTFCTPSLPKVTLEVKYGTLGCAEDLTKAHSVVSTPARPRSTALPRRAPAYAMDRVALPFPFFSLTTSVPASCTRTSSSGILAAGIVLAAASCEKSGRMVLPAWPPTTGTWAGLPVISWTNLLARTTSRVVMPTILLGFRPFFCQSSHMAGTTELTGFTMRAMTAFGQCFAAASTVFLAMPALMLSRSFLSWPGLRGTPAGTRMRSQPLRTSPALSIVLSSRVIVSGVTLHCPSMWERSVATPAAGTMAMFRSMITSSFTKGFVAIRSASGWPMPPAPPTTQTLNAPFGCFFAFRKSKQQAMAGKGRPEMPGWGGHSAVTGLELKMP